jgi:outer membrane protein assembly factor BamE
VSARPSILLGCVLASLALAGCIKPHRAPVAQGNVIMKKDAERLEVGMSRAQVEYLLGRPIVKEPFDQSRWNYVFYFRMQHREPTRNRVSLHFEDDTLTRIDGELRATADQVIEDQLTGEDGEDDPILDEADIDEDELDDEDAPEPPPAEPQDPTTAPGPMPPREPGMP